LFCLSTFDLFVEVFQMRGVKSLNRVGAEYAALSTSKFELIEGRKAAWFLPVAVLPSGDAMSRQDRVAQPCSLAPAQE
jgi:hypothetical protein